MGKLKTFSFGACAIAGYSPKRKDWKKNTKTINIKVKFEEALKLNLALDECIRKLNRYKMSTLVGKRAAVNLVLHLHLDRLAVAEDRV
ncbi:MAG: hypothetical protein ACYSSI_02555 [Planctomycetota bacterium]|jgi:hypothetical protein